MNLGFRYRGPAAPRVPEHTTTDPEGYGAALFEAVSDVDTLRERPNVDTLGTRVKGVETRNGERTYYLEGYVFRPADGGGAPQRFYRLNGGAGSAVSALNGEGAVVADSARSGRGLSREFRDWIAEVVAQDRERCGF